MRIVKRMLPVYVLSLAVVLAASVITSRTVSLLAETSAMAEPPGLPTVVLDPGHGGEDGGAVSADGTKESLLNLEISLRARDLLRFLGVPVTMTRDSDVSIYDPEAVTVSEKKVSDLKNRVKLTAAVRNPLLLSIHQNMFSEPKYRGAQVFYAQTAGSAELAKRIQELLNTQVDPGNRRQPKESESVYLMNKIQCTGVLVECGFLSNPEEEQRLKAPEYQRLLAAAICAGLTCHLAEEPSY